MQIKLTDYKSPELEKLIIVENDRGDWKVSRIYYGYQLLGYDGENCIMILLVWRQDGKVHITVTHSQCDTDTQIHSELVKDTSVEDWINAVLKIETD